MWLRNSHVNKTRGPNSQSSIAQWAVATMLMEGINMWENESAAHLNLPETLILRFAALMCFFSLGRFFSSPYHHLLHAALHGAAWCQNDAAFVRERRMRRAVWCWDEVIYEKSRLAVCVIKDKSLWTFNDRFYFVDLCGEIQVFCCCCCCFPPLTSIL